MKQVEKTTDPSERLRQIEILLEALDDTLAWTIRELRQLRDALKEQGIETLPKLHLEGDR